ncbi:Hypothetical_protein [Hexamita inflata]|uniref:Hypothetical_protein n=1 Tax=Hexamita inflata TaxID=28002 RepID=A0AA86R6G7_9EUKA|nr:Hypothetical protein HINF_LOCUS54577 [Hexamita inflata]
MCNVQLAEKFIFVIHTKAQHFPAKVTGNTTGRFWYTPSSYLQLLFPVFCMYYIQLKCPSLLVLSTTNSRRFCSISTIRNTNENNQNIFKYKIFQDLNKRTSNGRRSKEYRRIQLSFQEILAQEISRRNGNKQIFHNMKN